MTEITTKKRTITEKISDDNVIYVGKKPPINYVLAVVSQFNRNSFNRIILKARGKSISTAVDTAEIIRNRFMKDVNVKEIKIGTESVTSSEGFDVNVSSIEIDLSYKKK